MPKVDLVAELAGKLLHALEQQRQSGSDYPLTVASLAALADPQATPEQVRKALSKKGFAARWFLANKKDANSPLVLAEDVERLAASPLLLEYALGLLCRPDNALQTPTKAVNKVDKSLRPAFQSALDRQIADNALPATVGVTIVRGKPQLYLRRFPPPPPPPPKKKPAEELSEKLVRLLTEQRERNSDDYPPPLDRLIAETGIAATPAVVKRAIAGEPFRSQALVAIPSQPNSLAALTPDRQRLVASPGLLHSVLVAARTADTQIASVADLKTKIDKSLHALFTEAVNWQLSERALPDGVGVLLNKKKPLLFLLTDINAVPAPTAAPPPRTAEPKPPSPPPLDFARLFEEAFAQLDREHGGHNHVSLVALRRTVSVDRAAFDAGLRQLRRAGRYSLSAAEGRHGIRPEEQDAGIREDGSLLLFVSRREA